MQTRGQSIKLLDFRDELLLKIINCTTTTEGRGLLLCCRRLSDLARPNVFQKRQKEARRILFVFLDELWICIYSVPCRCIENTFPSRPKRTNGA